MGQNVSKAPQRLRGIHEESSRFLMGLRNRRASFRHVPQPAPGECPPLWHLLFAKNDLGELEDLWAAHVDMAWYHLQAADIAADGVRGQVVQDIYQRHYGPVGYQPAPEKELSRIEAVLFLRWLEWGSVDKEHLGRRYGTSRTRVKDLAGLAVLAHRSLTGVSLTLPRITRAEATTEADRRPAADMPAKFAVAAPLTYATNSIDLHAATRIRITAQYIDRYERALQSRARQLLITDVSGLATGFTCWLSANPVYQSVLLMSAKYQAVCRRHYGSSALGFRRTFIVDPARMNRAATERFAATLDLHLRLGLQTAVLYTGPHVPEEIIADVGLLGENQAVDFGHFETLDVTDTGPKEIFAEPTDSYFSDIRERVLWPVTPTNAEHIVIERPEQVHEVVRDLLLRLA
ncbi:MAG: hypothetical protein JNJ46_16810 [Myxococcales bacterium]|nr:hypothetical protein [Myxococcales bacterium]